MNRRKRYRLVVVFCLFLDLMAILFLGYRYLDRKIPDELQVSRESSTDVSQILKNPLITLEEAVPVSGDGSYMLSCKLLGYLPFKQIKVTPVEEEILYVSGNTVGIYMETEGVLIVDTGEIQSENGQAQEPAKNIVKAGDYIVDFNGQKISSKKDLIRNLERLETEEVTLKLHRNGETIPV